MITVLVKYKTWNDGGHALLDGNYIFKSKIVTVDKYEDLNSMFLNIVDVKTLGNSKVFNCVEDIRKEFIKQMPTDIVNGNNYTYTEFLESLIVNKIKKNHENQNGKI